MRVNSLLFDNSTFCITFVIVQIYCPQWLHSKSIWSAIFTSYIDLADGMMTNFTKRWQAIVLEAQFFDLFIYN